MANYALYNILTMSLLYTYSMSIDFATVAVE